MTIDMSPCNYDDFVNKIQFTNDEQTLALLLFQQAAKNTPIIPTVLSTGAIKQYILKQIDLPSQVLKTTFLKYFSNEKHQFNLKDVMFLLRAFAALQHDESIESPDFMLKTYPHTVKFQSQVSMTAPTPSINEKQAERSIGFEQTMPRPVINPQLPHPMNSGSQKFLEIPSVSRLDPIAHEDLANCQTLTQNETLHDTLNYLIDKCSFVQFIVTKEQQLKLKKQIADTNEQLQEACKLFDENIMQCNERSVESMVKLVQKAVDGMQVLKKIKLQLEKNQQQSISPIKQKINSLHNELRQKIEADEKLHSDLKMQLEAVNKKVNQQNEEQKKLLQQIQFNDIIKVGFKLGFAQAQKESEMKLVENTNESVFKETLNFHEETKEMEKSHSPIEKNNESKSKLVQQLINQSADFINQNSIEYNKSVESNKSVEPVETAIQLPKINKPVAIDPKTSEIDKQIIEDVNEQE